jgi:hypothetical protein
MQHLTVFWLLLLANLDYLCDVRYYLIKRIEMFFGDRSSERRAIQQALLKDYRLQNEMDHNKIFSESVCS